MGPFRLQLPCFQLEKSRMLWIQFQQVLARIPGQFQQFPFSHPWRQPEHIQRADDPRSKALRRFRAAANSTFRRAKPGALSWAGAQFHSRSSRTSSMLCWKAWAM